jgi:DNA-binding NarL/FixJ family response regulator
MKLALALKPDVVVLDIAMPHLSGLDAAQQIKQMPSTQLVFLTMNQSPEVAADAFRRGASGYVLKQSAAEELVSAIRTVLRGGSHLSHLVARDGQLPAEPK